jgi:aspartyl-tRNA(Asn)/glutamyl-tRNA(Gln) amidotransferase subunit C
MPQGFTRERVAAIAALAHLELDSSELDLFARQLGSILAHADAVQQVDTTGVLPTASVVARHASERLDQRHTSIEIAETLANTPDPDRTQMEGGFFKVPRVIG